MSAPGAAVQTVSIRVFVERLFRICAYILQTPLATSWTCTLQARDREGPQVVHNTRFVLHRLLTGQGFGDEEFAGLGQAVSSTATLEASSSFFGAPCSMHVRVRPACVCIRKWIAAEAYTSALFFLFRLWSLNKVCCARIFHTIKTHWYFPPKKGQHMQRVYVQTTKQCMEQKPVQRLTSTIKCQTHPIKATAL